MIDLIDIGANLTDRTFDADRAEVLARARAVGVRRMLLTGTTLEASGVARDLAHGACGLYSTAGVHPHHARDCDEDTLPALRTILASPRVLAVGECGLDYNRNYSPQDVQRTWFERQVELAVELQRPLFLHERDAVDDFVEILSRHRPHIVRAVIHCFTGDAAALERYLELGLHVGITGWICDERRGAHLVDLVGRIPSDRLMIETDSPYLLPRTIRPRPKSRRNEPAFLTAVLETVASARGESLERVAESTTRTAEAFFGIPSEPASGPATGLASGPGSGQA